MYQILNLDFEEQKQKEKLCYCSKWRQRHRILQKTHLTRIILLPPRQGYHWQHKNKQCWNAGERLTPTGGGNLINQLGYSFLHRSDSEVRVRTVDFSSSICGFHLRLRGLKRRNSQKIKCIPHLRDFLTDPLKFKRKYPSFQSAQGPAAFFLL